MRSNELLAFAVVALFMLIIGMVFGYLNSGWDFFGYIVAVILAFFIFSEEPKHLGFWRELLKGLISAIIVFIITSLIYGMYIKSPTSPSNKVLQEVRAAGIDTGKDNWALEYLLSASDREEENERSATLKDAFRKLNRFYIFTLFFSAFLVGLLLPCCDYRSVLSFLISFYILAIIDSLITGFLYTNLTALWLRSFSTLAMIASGFQISLFARRLLTPAPEEAVLKTD